MPQSTPLLVVALSLCVFLTAADASESRGLLNICYGEYGCFTSGYPFGGTLQRPIALLPDSPDVIDTRFLLYTRESSDKAQVIDHRTTLGTWDRTKATKVLVHGFLDSINSTWWPQMKDAFLQAEDCNVVLVDWNRANYFPYTKATANAQVVGAGIALLVNTMIKGHGGNPADFHIVAHSLGCAVAGYAGHLINGLGRITGLDPAGPFFENTDPIVRLDPTDAKFVDIIHTDGSHTLLLGFGTLQQVGHVDFYPNKGMNQPSCSTTGGKLISSILTLGPLDILGPMDIQGFFNTTLCSHFAAVHLFTNSILNRCIYRAFACESDEEFRDGKCLFDGNEGNFMGYHASSSKALGRLYLDTQFSDKAPFCMNHYQISLASTSDFVQTKGEIRLTITGSQATQTVLFDPEETSLKRNSVETRYIPMKIDLGTIQRVNIEFQRTGHWISSPLYSSKWSFKRVTLVNGDKQTSATFCPGDNAAPLEAGNIARFSQC